MENKKKVYYFSAFPGPLREKHLRAGFEILIRFLEPRSTQFICYGWKDSGISHQDVTRKEVFSALGPFISWERPAPEFTEDGFAAGGSVSQGMIEVLLKAPTAMQASPTFAFKLIHENDSLPIFECGDYEDFTFSADEDEIEILKQLFDEAQIPFLVK